MPLYTSTLTLRSTLKYVEVFSIWVAPEETFRPYYDQANEQIDSIESFVRRNASQVGLARSADEIKKLVAEGKFVARSLERASDSPRCKPAIDWRDTHGS